MKFLLSRLFILALLFAWFSAVSNAGSDDVEWRDYSIYTTYDKDDEELEVKFVTYSDWNPHEDFTLEMEIDGEDCEMDLEYKSFQVKGTCILDIDEEDIRGIYNTSLEVFDEDDESVYKDTTVEIEIAWYEEEFDWEDIKIDGVYDEAEEELELKIYLEDVSREPDYEYEMEFKIDNKTFKKDFKYDEDEEELSITFDTRIDDEDIEDEYEVDIEVFNKDLDDEEVGDEKIEFEVEMIAKEDDLDWYDLEATWVYDDVKERLTLKLILEDVSNEPKGSYESFIEFESEDYDERFKYDEDEEHLIAEYTIKIDEDDLGYYYDLEVVVEDKDEDEVFDDEVDLRVEDLSEADDFDWDELIVTAKYDEDKERLYVELVLEDIKDTPTFSYIAEVEFADEEDDLVFKYDEDKEELRVSMDARIDEDDVEDKYEIEIEIENDDQERVYREDVDVVVWDYKEEVQESDDDYEWDETKVTFDYNTQSQYLTVEVIVDWINDYPSLDYYTDLRISGMTAAIWSKLKYESSKERLIGTYNLYVKGNDIEDEYNLTMFINDEYDDLQHLFSEKVSVIFDKWDEEDEEEWVRYISTSTKKAVDNFIDKIYDRYNSDAEALEYFELVIVTLDTYAKSKTRYKSVIDDINYLLQEEIDSNS
jgi:hypothetical protein